MGGKRVKAGSRPPEDQSLFPDEGNQNFVGGRNLIETKDVSDDY